MLPSEIMTFMSLIQAPSTPRSVLVARAMPCWMASSKLVSEIALISVTRATDIKPPFVSRSLHLLYPQTREINTRHEGRRGCGESPLGRTFLELGRQHGMAGRLA